MLRQTDGLSPKWKKEAQKAYLLLIHCRCGWRLMALWAKKQILKPVRIWFSVDCNHPTKVKTQQHSKEKSKNSDLLCRQQFKSIWHCRSTNDTKSSWEIFYFLINHNHKCKEMNSKVSSLWHQRRERDREAGAYLRTDGWGLNLGCSPDCVGFCCAVGSLEQHSPSGHLCWVCSKQCWPTHGLASQSESPLKTEMAEERGV